MHYHIMWGSNTAEEPSVLNYTNRDEAISKFIEIVKTVEGADKPPPPMEETVLNAKTRFFRMVTATHKYIIVYCDNGCYTSEMKGERYSPVLN
jgi:hypothetical protein